MFSTTCAECHKQCEVPFRPNGNKPVYCNECFSSRREDSPREDYPKRDFSPKREYPKRDFSPAQTQARPQFDDSKRQFEAINVKLDKLIELLSKNAAPVVSPIQVHVEKKVEKVVASPKKEIKKTPVVSKKSDIKIAPKKKVVAKKK